MLNLIIDNFAFFLQSMTGRSSYLGWEMFHYKNMDYYHSRSCEQLLNGIFIRNTECFDLPRYISELIDRFENHGSSYTLWLPDLPLPLALQSFFETKNLDNPSPLICMSSRLDEITPLSAMKELQTLLVQSQREYDLYMDILSIGFKFSKPLKQDFKRMLASYGRKDSLFKHYIGYLQDKAVAVISTFSYQNTLGMYCGTTLPEYQNRGICTELYRYTMIDGLKSGKTHCVYQSANHAIVNIISQKFGFKQHGRLLRLCNKP